MLALGPCPAWVLLHHSSFCSYGPNQYSKDPANQKWSWRLAEDDSSTFFFRKDFPNTHPHKITPPKGSSAFQRDWTMIGSRDRSIFHLARQTIQRNSQQPENMQTSTTSQHTREKKKPPKSKELLFEQGHSELTLRGMRTMNIGNVVQDCHNKIASGVLKFPDIPSSLDPFWPLEKLTPSRTKLRKKWTLWLHPFKISPFTTHHSPPTLPWQFAPLCPRSTRHWNLVGPLTQLLHQSRPWPCHVL